MVRFTWRTQEPCGTSQRTNLLCRGVRSTAVRCFKSNSDDTGVKPSTGLRLNFKIPYRVNFGQSLGLVGSGDSLGNWDPKRTVQMKWTDGDWWTVELTVSPGGSLDLEYKYVVVNHDGNIINWKPGSNYRVALALPSNGTRVARRVKVADAWDDSFKKVDVEEAEVPPPASTSTGAGASAGASSNGAPPVSKPPTAPPPVQQPAPRAQQPAAAAAASGSASTPPPPVAPSPVGTAAGPASAAASTTPVAQPTTRYPSTPTPTPQAPQAPQAPASTNGVAASPLLATQTPEGSVATQAAAALPPPPPPAPPPAPDPADGVKRPQARAVSPRSAPPSFAAATSIPALHPTLLAEQERLEDGVKNSLEDLQMQMDKHQQLREKTDEAKLAAAEATAARLANTVEALTKEVASLRRQHEELQGLLKTACEMLTALLLGPERRPNQEAVQQFVLAQAKALGAQNASAEAPALSGVTAAVPVPDATERPGVVSAVPEVGVLAGTVTEGSGEKRESREGGVGAVLLGPLGTMRVEPPIAQRARDRKAEPASQRVTASSTRVRKEAAQRVGSVRAFKQLVGVREQQPAVAAGTPAAARAEPAVAVAVAEPVPVTPTQRTKVGYRVRSAAGTTASPARARRAPGGAGAPEVVKPQAKAKAAATAVAAPSVASPATPAAVVPVVCGVGKGAAEGARGQFSVASYLGDGSARSKVPACIRLQSVKRQSTWADVVPPREVTPLEFLQEGGLRGKNWKASIRVESGGVPGEPVGEYLQRQQQEQASA